MPGMTMPTVTKTQRLGEEIRGICILGGFSDLQTTAVRAIKVALAKTAKYLVPQG